MPTQLELPFGDTDDEAFGSPYLTARVALGTLEQLGFTADLQVIQIYRNESPPEVTIEIGWPGELASEHDRDIFAQLIEDSGRPISKCGSRATVDIGQAKLTLNGAFEHPELVVGRPTLEDLYPARPGDRGARGRLNPVMEDALKPWIKEYR